MAPFYGGRITVSRYHWFQGMRVMGDYDFAKRADQGEKPLALIREIRALRRGENGLEEMKIQLVPQRTLPKEL